MEEQHGGCTPQHLRSAHHIIMTAAAADAAAVRLKAALAKIASNELDECPVCFEVPTAKDARVLRCCAGIMCRHCIPNCGHTCPLCRQSFLLSDQPVDDYAKSDEYESPYAYTTHDYSQHSEFVTSLDYTVVHKYDASGNRTYQAQAYTSKDYTSKDYSAASSSSSYSATTDYSVSGSYTTKDYTASSYSASASYTTQDYSAMGDYSVSADKYKVQR